MDYTEALKIAVPVIGVILIPMVIVVWKLARRAGELESIVEENRARLLQAEESRSAIHVRIETMKEKVDDALAKHKDNPQPHSACATHASELSGIRADTSEIKRSIHDIYEYLLNNKINTGLKPSSGG